MLDRILVWPSERQEDALRLLASMEAQDASVYRLAKDQVEEIERRRADAKAEILTLGAFNERFGLRAHS